MKRVWTVAFLYWVVVSALCCWLYPVTVYDTMARYAPMADAFARGDWQYAFHPRFGVLFTTLAGCVSWATGLKGDCACQVVATFFLAISSVPAWAIAKRVFGDAFVAWIVAVMVLVATEYFVYAQDGLRDTVRIFGIAMCAYAFLSGKAWSVAVGLFCLVTVRTDLFVISGAILVAWTVFCLVSASRRSFVAVAGPGFSWLLGANLMCLMTYLMTGWYLPGTQFITHLTRIAGGAR